MEPTKELIDTIFRERVLRARQLSAEEKFLAGPRLFDHVCRVMRDGIRHQHPDADAQQVDEILSVRLVLARRLQERR